MKANLDREFTHADVWSWKKPHIKDEIWYTQYVEEAGLDSVWQGESRLVRDTMTAMGACTQVTDEIDLAPDVTNCYIRGVAVMIQTFSTLRELSGGRVKLSIGVWQSPLAPKVGIKWERPFHRMWGYCTITKRPLDLGNVTYEEQTLSVDDIELDLVRSDAQSRGVPIYIGAMGETMYKLTDELVGEGTAGGTFMNYLILPEHNLKDLEKLKEDVGKQDGALEGANRPQLIAVAMNEDVSVIIDQARGLATQYIDQQLHIRKASGIDPELVEKVQAEMGGWPASAEDIERTSQYVDDDMVTNIVVAGTRDNVTDRVRNYCTAGCTEPVVYPLMDSTEAVIDVLIEAKTEAQQRSHRGDERSETES